MLPVHSPETRGQPSPTGSHRALPAGRPVHSRGSGRRERLTLLWIVILSLGCSALGVVLRGVPEPWVHDEYSYLFAGETFALFRLSNPSPPVPQAFFSPHILVEPSFASKYPPAQGLFLAIGTLLGLPIAGVWLSGALAAAALHWCARAVLPRPYALIPVAMFVLTQLITSTWVSSYWGGLVTFLGGSLVLGFLLRSQSPELTAGSFILAGTGAGILALSRPFEGLLLCVLGAAVFARPLVTTFRKMGSCTLLLRLSLALGMAGAALAFQGALNHAVTGSVLRMPYSAFQEQYLSVPPFLWQEPTTPLHPDTRILRLEQSWVWGDSWLSHLATTFYAMWQSVIELVGGTGAALLAGSAVYAAWLRPRLLALLLLAPVMQSVARYVGASHYFAALSPTWFLLPGVALAFIAEQYRLNSRVVLVSLSAMVSLPVLPHLLSPVDVSVSPRTDLVERLRPLSPVLALVTYSDDLSPHVHVVYNDPELRNPVLLANNLGPVENCELVRSFPERTVMLVTLGPEERRIESADVRAMCDLGTEPRR